MGFEAQLTREIGPRPEWLTQGTWNIAIAGQTGVGKSSVINRLRGLDDMHPESAEVNATGDTTHSPKPYRGQGPFEGVLQCLSLDVGSEPASVVVWPQLPQGTVRPSWQNARMSTLCILDPRPDGIEG